MNTLNLLDAVQRFSELSPKATISEIAEAITTGMKAGTLKSSLDDDGYRHFKADDLEKLAKFHSVGGVESFKESVLKHSHLLSK